MAYKKPQNWKVQTTSRKGCDVEVFFHTSDGDPWMMWNHLDDSFKAAMTAMGYPHDQGRYGYSILLHFANELDAEMAVNLMACWRI